MEGFTIVIVIVVIISVVLLFDAVLTMISKTGRSLWWILIGLILSPIIVVPILYCLGDTDKMRKKKIIEEEKWRREVE